MTQRPQVPFWVLPLNLALLLAVLGLVATVWFSRSRLPSDQLLAMRLVHNQVVEKHVLPPAPEDLMWSAVEGMVGSLDPHSEFVRPERVSAFEDDTTGSYAGIGIVMVSDLAPVTVQFPFPDGPSDRAGLRVGDQIISVEGKPLVTENGKTPRQNARDALLGEPGTKVTLQIRRGDEDLDKVVERGRVRTPSVKWARLLDAELGIGYVYIEAFQPDTTAEFSANIDHLRRLAQGRLRGLVVDLRYNRGGMLDEAIALTNLFLDSGTIVSLKRRDRDDDETHEADPSKCTLPDLPLAVLVNYGSASASEVLAGAVRDHERATLVGERTFGKGVVQSIFQWEDLDFRLKLTTAHYYTPNGNCIERHNRRKGDPKYEGGILPHREVKLAAELAGRADRTTRRQKLHAILEQYDIPFAARAAVEQLAREHGFKIPAPPGPDEDNQLAAALEEVRNRVAQ